MQSCAGTAGTALHQRLLPESACVLFVRGSGRGRQAVGRAVRGDDPAVGEQLTGVLEEHDTVAQQTPPLFRVGSDHSGAVTVGGLGPGTSRLVDAHSVASLAGPGRSASCRADVLVDPEHVLRVVAGLDLSQAVVVIPVGR
jgi:hypothetical protein